LVTADQGEEEAAATTEEEEEVQLEPGLLPEIDQQNSCCSSSSQRAVHDQAPSLSSYFPADCVVSFFLQQDDVVKSTRLPAAATASSNPACKQTICARPAISQFLDICLTASSFNNTVLLILLLSKFFEPVWQAFILRCLLHSHDSTNTCSIFTCRVIITPAPARY
jgi:hypothetical protein